jgi:hypothetical protein
MKNSLRTSVGVVGAKARALVALAVLGASTMAATVAHAAGESASATQAATAVGTTQTDLALVFAAVLTMAIATWGIFKIIKVFGGGR